MSMTFNQHTAKDNQPVDLTIESQSLTATGNETSASNIILLPSRALNHHNRAGLNPVVDAAGHLFTVIGKLKTLKSYRQLNKLQSELIQEINSFQDSLKTQNYGAEYIIVCRYVLCATLDEIISNTTWGGQGQWDAYALLAAYNQDTQHQDKFFTIMDRAIKEPATYIDLMELLYLCLSMGYKGQYRSTEHNQFQLEQITNSLYKHIRAYRGSFSKTLSPAPLKATKTPANTGSTSKSSLVFIFLVTACVMMTIFLSLGYIMDVISNEAYQTVTQLEKPVLHESSLQ